MRISAVVLTLVFSLLVMAPGAGAQTTHAVTPAALDAAVQQQVTATDADRELVKRLLDRDDVKAVAAGAGIDLRSMSTAVNTLDPVSVSGIASQARAVDQALAGGQSTVTISTTVIIIALLILILIVVA